MGVELPLLVVVTILECCVTFSGVKLSIRSFVLLLLICSSVYSFPKYIFELPDMTHATSLSLLSLTSLSSNSFISGSAFFL